MPHPSCATAPSDFCNKELTAGQFQRKVARLNGNILALCDTQNVNARQLVATHTLANLLQLLSASELGRSGAVEVSNSLVADVAHLNAELLAGGDESDSDGEFWLTPAITNEKLTLGVVIFQTRTVFRTSGRRCRIWPPTRRSFRCRPRRHRRCCRRRRRRC